MIDNKRTLINEVGDAKEESSKCLKVECQTDDINFINENISDNEDEGSYLTLDSPLFLEEINKKDLNNLKEKNNSNFQNKCKIFVCISGYDSQVYKVNIIFKLNLFNLNLI